MSTIIPLSQGMFAIVSPEDFEELSRYRWHVTLSGRKARPHPYAVRWDNVTKKRVHMHRQVLRVDDSVPVVDHINGRTLDNRRENLRPATLSQNAANVHSFLRTSISGERCIERLPSGKFRIVVKVDARKHQFGSFASMPEAIAARDGFIEACVLLGRAYARSSRAERAA